MNSPNTTVLWFDKGCDLICTVMRKRCPTLSNAQDTTQLPSPTAAGLQKTKICCQEGFGMAGLLERLGWVQCPTPPHCSLQTQLQRNAVVQSDFLWWVQESITMWVRMNSWFFAKTRFQTEDGDSKIAIQCFHRNTFLLFFKHVIGSYINNINVFFMSILTHKNR